MIKPIFPVVAFAATVLAGAAVAQPVGEVVVRGHAPPDAEVKTQDVGFTDINANSPDGARILFQRIRTAAAKVCSPQPDQFANLPERQDMQNFLRCEVDSINVAVADVRSPALDRYVDSLR